jgi:hypothetical protein
MDADHPSVTSFRPKSVPRVLPPHGSSSQPHLVPSYPKQLSPHHTQLNPLGLTHTRHSGDMPVASPAPSRGCSCIELSHGRVWPHAQEHTPLWLFTPSWNPDWTPAEIQREECRRLVWNTLTLIAGYTNYRSAMGYPAPDLFLMHADHVRSSYPKPDVVRTDRTLLVKVHVAFPRRESYPPLVPGCFCTPALQ